MLEVASGFRRVPACFENRAVKQRNYTAKTECKITSKFHSKDSVALFVPFFSKYNPVVHINFALLNRWTTKKARYP